MILVFITITGCSVTRKNLRTEFLDENGTKGIFEQIKALNITNSDFNIMKAEISIKNNMESRKMMGSMKYKKPGTYLISIRSQAGIEAARIFITEDTILINDRINKKLYYGSPDYLFEKYGITTSVLPIIMGDYIANITGDEQNKCENNYLNIKEIISSKEIIFNIDCKKKKVVDVSTIDPESGKGIVIKFEKFDKGEGVAIARNIKITDSAAETNIFIQIEKIEKGIKNEITFIPGRNYEKVLLR